MGSKAYTSIPSPFSGVPGNYEPTKDAVAFLKDDDFNMYVGLLLQALELGRYRIGFPKS
jgi:hypothetical protein